MHADIKTKEKALARTQTIPQAIEQFTVIDDALLAFLQTL